MNKSTDQDRLEYVKEFRRSGLFVNEFATNNGFVKCYMLAFF